MYISRSAGIVIIIGILKIFVKLSFVNGRSVFHSRFCFRFCWECETGLMRCWWRMAAHSEMVRSQIFAPPPPNWASSPSPAVTTSNHLNLKDPPIHRTPNNSTAKTQTSKTHLNPNPHNTQYHVNQNKNTPQQVNTSKSCQSKENQSPQHHVHWRSWLTSGQRATKYQ